MEINQQLWLTTSRAYSFGLFELATNDWKWTSTQFLIPLATSTWQDPNSHDPKLCPPQKNKISPSFFTIVLSLNHRVFTQSIDHLSKTPQEDVDLLGVVLGTTRSAISILVEPLAPYRSEALLGYGSITMVYNSNNYGLWYL